MYCSSCIFKTICVPYNPPFYDKNPDIMNYEISTYKNKYTETLNNEYIERIFFIYLYILYILFNYKARDNTNKKSQFTM